MNNPIENLILNDLLSNNGKQLYAEETDTVEFKSEFDWDDKEKRAKYCKSMAALCNNKGGYLVFGIENETNKILGVKNFDKVDPASISSHLNNYFSPAIVFQKTSNMQAGKEIGVIHIEQHKDIPTICIKTFANILKDGALFYRYPGKSEMINGTDLIHLLHQIKGSNSKEMVDLKKIEMRQAALPNLRIIQTGTEQTVFTIILKNWGKTCQITEIKNVSGYASLFEVKTPCFLDPGDTITIKGASNNGAPANFMTCEIALFYQDTLENKYAMNIKISIGGGFSISKPKEL